MKARHHRTHLSVPLAEMRRLMRVYGSIKCLRKSAAGEYAKDESVKRKFYRWFPDLEERFFRDAAGFWRPIFGHEVEMRWREEMRREDREVTSKKRTTSKMRARNRKLRLGGAAVTVPVATAASSGAELAGPPFIRRVSGGGNQDSKRAETLCNPVSAAPPPVAQPRFDQSTTMEGADAPIIEEDVPKEAVDFSISAHNMASTSTGCKSAAPAPPPNDFKQAGTLSVSGYNAASAWTGCDSVSPAPPPVEQPRFDRESTTTEGADTSIIEYDDPKHAEALSRLVRNLTSTSTGCNPVAPSSCLVALCFNRELPRSEDANGASTIGGTAAPVSRDSKRAEALSTPAHEAAPTLKGCNSVSPAPGPVLQPYFNQDAPRFENARAASIVIANAEPPDGSFRAERGIFDDVERSFYGARPGLASSSSCGSTSSEDTPPSKDSMLGDSMVEFCEEVLASGF